MQSQAGDHKQAVARRLAQPAVLGLLCLAQVSACAGPPGGAPCADFDCSGHGTCVALPGAAPGDLVPTCRCHAGYQPSDSGWLCLPAGASSLCAGIDCGGNGRCVSYRGAPRCLCDPGHSPLEPFGHSCVDVCANIDCGAEGRCVADGQAPRCACDAGAWLDPLTGRCLAEERLYLTYRLVAAAQPTLVVGHATIDLSQLPEGQLHESLRYDLPLFGLAGHWRQTWTLARAGDLSLDAVELDQILVEGDVSRRRHTRATFDHGAGSAELQRLDRRFTRALSYAGPSTPVPMPGGFEFPGASAGALSPASYLLLLERFLDAPSDPQDPSARMIEVFWPAPAAIGWTRVQGRVSGDGSGDATLELVDLNLRISYREAVPRQVELAALGLSWRLDLGMPRDSNLPLAPEAKPLPQPSLPGLSERSLQLASADGTSLAAIVAHAPQAPAGLAPAVLLVAPPHALDADRPHRRLPGSPLYRQLAAHLAAAGYATLRHHPRPLSERTRLSELIADGRAAYQALAAEPDVDRSRIYLLGHGVGALVALGMLGDGVPVRGLIGLAPIVADVREAALYAETAHFVAAGVEEELLADLRDATAATLDQLAGGSYKGERWRGLPTTLWRDLLSFDGRGSLVAFDVPLLLLRGAEDLLTPPAQLLLAEQAAAAADAELKAITLPGLAFNLGPGSRADIWERAHFPLEVPQAVTAELIAWLGGKR